MRVREGKERKIGDEVRVRGGEWRVIELKLRQEVRAGNGEI